MDSRVTKNYILLAIIKQIGLPHRQKKHLYLLITILGDLIAYRGGIINFKIELIQVTIKGK